MDFSFRLASRSTPCSSKRLRFLPSDRPACRLSEVAKPLILLEYDAYG